MRPSTIVFLVFALCGMIFSGVSTWDFMAHLDRDVHDITCSFIPGLLESEQGGGCQVTLMSPYSSVFRASIWGGLPISLPGLAVFAFLLFRGLDLVFNRREDDQRATTFLVAASVLPTLTSLVMGYLSLVELDAACKLCIGIYVSSVGCLVAAIITRMQAAGSDMSDFGREFGLSFAEGVAFVAIPCLVYAMLAPDYSSFAGTCGTLAKPDDPNGVLLPIGQQASGKTAVEVFDPLCSACKGFEGRLDASGLSGELKRKALLFPLDNTCNWMVSTNLHPGACTVSEAVLCAEGKADTVIDWAFEHQDAILKASASDPLAAEQMVTAAFPDLKGCVGKPAVKARLNKSLRWAVANQLPVLTPQLYVEGTKLCDADTDLGLDYALTNLLGNMSKVTP